MLQQLRACTKCLPCIPFRAQSEHERYLTEEVFKQPIIVYNYPKDIKVRLIGNKAL